MKTTTEITDYEQTAIDFLNATNTSFTAIWHDFAKYFDSDKEPRHIYRITLKNDLHTFRFKFGNSIMGGDKAPTAYSVLAALTKYDVGSFDDFISEFGYDMDTAQARKAAERTYKAVVKEYENVCKLFTGEQIELLQDIN